MYYFPDTGFIVGVGDINSDDSISILDIIPLIDHIISEGSVDPYVADINQDGDINVIDAVFLVQIIFLHT